MIPQEFLKDPKGWTSLVFNDALLAASKCNISVAEIADNMDCSEWTLYHAANPNSEGANIHLYRFLLTLAKTQKLEPLDKIETLFNRIAFTLPEANSETDDLNRETYQMLSDLGEFLKEEHDDLVKGDLTKEELQKCLEKGHRVIRDLASLLKHLEQFYADHHPEDVQEIPLRAVAK